MGAGGAHTGGMGRTVTALVTVMMTVIMAVTVLPMAPRVLIPAGGGIVGICWARRRFGAPTLRRGSAPGTVTGAA